MAAALPVFRQVVADAIVDETAKANASFAVTTGLAETIPVLTAPLNLGDMIVLTKNQLIMGYKIALAAGRNDEPAGDDVRDPRRDRRGLPVPPGRAPARRADSRSPASCRRSRLRTPAPTRWDAA